MSTYVDGRAVSTLVDTLAFRATTTRRPASLAALLPYQLTELLDHVDEELPDDRLIVRAHEVEGVAPVGSGQQVVVLADAATLIGHEQPDHPPVIGIAALASSVAQLDLRDSWIGWSAASFLEQLEKDPTAANAKWLLSSVENLIDAIYTKDLLNDKIVTRSAVATPTEEAIRRLRAEAAEAKKKHRQNVDAAAIKRRETSTRAASASTLPIRLAASSRSISSNWSR